MPTPIPSLEPLVWRNILTRMQERLVVPIIGPDAVVVDGDDGPRPYTEYLARWVEADLGLPPGDRPPVDLNEVACRYLQMPRVNRENLYVSVKLALDAVRPDPPEALRRLAGIRPFKLYVTTGFDDLLRTAIDAQRFKGQRRTESFAFSPQHKEDLPGPLSSLAYPVVYHLLGRATAAPEYVVTEEDTLEWVHSLQSHERQPERLLGELRSRSLLIIGSGHPDWLARFFLRAAKGERLLDAHSRTDVVAEEEKGARAPLGTFLEHFSAATRLYPGGAFGFIDELAERWEEHALAHPQEEEPDAAEPEGVEHAIFISYAHEDGDLATELEAVLTAEGLPVWLDVRGGLKGGDAWNRTISTNIDRASIFVPLLTPSVLQSTRRYFRTEWSFAEETSRKASEDQPFVVPICVGEVSAGDPRVDEFIREVHWIRVGEGDRRFASALAELKRIHGRYLRALEGSA